MKRASLQGRFVCLPHVRYTFLRAGNRGLRRGGRGERKSTPHARARRRALGGERVAPLVRRRFSLIIGKRGGLQSLKALGAPDMERVVGVTQCLMGD